MNDVVELKMVSGGRIVAFSPVSPQRTRQVMDALESEGQVDPEVTMTGRKWYSPREADVILRATGRIR